MVHIEVETEWIDWRKHGRPFIRCMAASKFIEPVHTEWGRKVMKQFFVFDVEEGTLLQVRLSDGSWKNDSKHYARVAPDGSCTKVSRDEAAREIVALKLAAAAPATD